MAISLSQSIDLNCPQCGHRFSAEIWLIVDAAGRPDLLEKIEQGKLHEFPCQNCGFAGQVDAPLLLYRPGEKPTLIFSPARETSQQQDQEQAAGLLNALRQQLGSGWQEKWLEQLLNVSREILATALTDGLEAAARLAQEQAQAEDDTARQDLRAILEELSQPARLQDMPHRINLCRRALELISREQSPERWAALQWTLANNLAQNPLGERAENIEQAIGHYRQALEVRTRQAYPEQWATTQNNRFVADRTGLLVERGQGEFSFPHLTFQEYLAARDIFKRTQGDLQAAWEEINEEDRLHAAHWREVILLLLAMLGKLGRGAPSTRLMEKILEAGQADPYERVLHRRLHLCARALSDRVNAAQPLRERVVAELLQIARLAPSWERDDAIAALGGLEGDEQALAGLGDLAGDPQVDPGVRHIAYLNLKRLLRLSSG